MPACGMPLRGGDDIRSVNAYPLLKITQVTVGGTTSRPAPAAEH